MRHAMGITSSVLLSAMLTCSASAVTTVDPFFSIGMSHQRLGRAVALEGNVAVVGSGNDAAYFVDTTTGNLMNTVFDTQPGWLGEQVELHQGTAYIGRYEPPGVGGAPGVVFKYDPLTGVQSGMYQEPTTEARSYAVEFDVSDDYVMVGALGVDGDFSDPDTAIRAHAYVYDANTGNELYQFYASDSVYSFPPDIFFLDFSGFGADVAVDGTYAAAGAPDHKTPNPDGSNATQGGGAYVFDLTTGQELYHLENPNNMANDDFGRQIDISGSLMAVASPRGDAAFGSGGNEGTVHVYDVTTGDLLYQLSGQSADDRFGTSIDVEGNYLAIGAPSADGTFANQGAVYIYNATSGELVETLAASDASDGSRFGSSLSIDGNRIIMGAEGINDDAGATYLFNLPALIGGDFDGNGFYECADVDALVTEIVAGTNQAQFDLTGDNLVNDEDLTAWLAEAGSVGGLTASGNPVLRGDATLDGNVDGQDFLIWNTEKFTDDKLWCGGDFNADGTTDGADFLVWNGNKFMTADSITSVPEPPAMTMLCALFVAAVLGRWTR